jgi:hypothetical protein
VIEVILPVLDEAEAIPGVIAAMPPGYAPLIVDNGSCDGSSAVAGALGARVVHEPRRGFGAACFAGLQAARSEIVCFMDCDGSLDPRELPRVADPVLTASADLCVGARVKAAAGSWPWHARLANRVLALEVRRRSGVPLHDIGPMRAARREALLGLGLADRGFGWPLEMILRAAAAGWAIDEVPVGYGRRTGGRSKVSGSARGTARAVRDMGALLADRDHAPAGDRAPEGARAAATSARVAGLAGLAATVAAAVWIAVGAAAGPRWLELPGRSHPAWIQGPLHALAGGVGSLPQSSLSLALILLAGGYGLALTCARAISVRLALATVVLANLAFTVGPTIVSSDVFGYIAYARELVPHGLNPYVFPPAALGHDAVLHFVYWKHEASPYGPLFTFLTAPLGLLTPGAALWVLKAAAGLASIAIAAVVARLARARGVDPSRAAIFVGLNPVLLFYAVSGAHNDLLATALLVCGLALVLARRPAAGAAVAVAGAAVKVTVGLALPFVVLLARRDRHGRSAVKGALIAVAAIAIPALALFGAHLFDQLHRITADPRFDIGGSGPDLVARALHTQITPAIRLAGTAAATAVCLAMGIRAWRGADPVAAGGWALVALVASIASLAPWYLVWLLPAAALGRSRALSIATLLLTSYLLASHLPVLGGHPWLSGG